jgi:endo-1,4-beta-D-glucanase Y
MVCAMSTGRALLVVVLAVGCGGPGAGKTSGTTGGDEGGNAGASGSGGAATGGKTGMGGTTMGSGGGPGTGGTTMGSGGGPGTGGATMGSGGSEGAADAGPTDGSTAPGLDGGCPAAAMPGATRRPFPQHVGYPGCSDCIHPTVDQAMMDADIKAAYDSWKKLLKTVPMGDVANEYVVSAGAAGNINGWPAGVGPITQSEGHGYGMMILALMAGYDPMAKMYFDSMNRVRKAFPSREDPRLMSWVVPKNGSKAVKPQPPATDGDMDMAYALLLAYDQWGDETNNHYLADAKTIIGAMETVFITKGPATSKYYPRLNIGDHDHLNSGAPENKPDMTRPSDFMVDHMRAFGRASGHSIWMDVENGSLSILQSVRDQTTGLVPDFVVADPPVPSKTGTADEAVCYECYSFNSCRVPWRQTVAIVQYGVAGSRDVAGKMVAWARGKYKDDPTTMGSDFSLAGVPKGTGDSAFTSPMVAAAVTDPKAQGWLDKGWGYMKQQGGKGYYGGSITLMAMLAVSGNWWIPSAGTGGCN